MRFRPLPMLFAGAVSLASVAQAPRPTQAADHNDPIGVQAAYKSGESAAGYEVNTNDPSGDIADIFAWYTGEKGKPQSVVFALTWRADPVEAREKRFDPTVKYGIHIDTSDKKIIDVSVDAVDGIQIGSKFNTHATNDIIVWFGEHKTKKGEWGMMVNGIPGVDKEVIGPVGKVLTPAPGVKVAAGLFDDAFFADLDAFFNSISVALGNNGNPSLPLDRFNRVDPKKSAPTRPFGYPANVDGFGRQNVHAVVIEVPASAFPTRKLHVWGTTDRKEGLAKSGAKLGCTFDANGGVYHCGDKGGAQ
jgi:hypothetical protein